MKYIRSIALLVILLGIGIARPALAVVGDATGLFTITKTGFVLNRATNTFDTTVSIKNVSPFTVSAPIQLTVSGLPSGVTLANAAGTTQGKPYVNVTVPGNKIIPNAIVTSILLKFANPARIALAPALSVYGDIPQAAVGLPPDPGAAGMATVEGTDLNGNGVRDDVERWIAFNYPSSEKTRAALYQQTSANQLLLFAGKNKDSAAALSASAQDDNANACLIYILGVDQRIAVGRTLFAEMLNTRARNSAYLDYNDLLRGKVLGSGPLNKKDGCAFDPDLMRN
ncbi:MAG: hypothetical protein ABI747_03625 [Candidatus Moraniibacteriota bacterium]